MDDVTVTRQCLLCKSSRLRPFLALGDMPITADFFPASEAEARVRRVPLGLAFCEGCTLVQLTHGFPMAEMFRSDYPYFSSYSESLVRWGEAHARNIGDRLGLGSVHRVIEIGSNDGYLLQWFAQTGIQTLGIDPAYEAARKAEAKGVQTHVGWFSQELAQALVRDGVRADVVIANNVLAHQADLHDFVAGIAHVLRSGGALIVEVPYVREMCRKNQFDTIYHEHLAYFSRYTLQQLFAAHGLYVQDVEPIEAQGGSLRLWMGKDQAVGESLAEQLRAEANEGLGDLSYYEAFADRTHYVREKLNRLLKGIRRKGKRISAYGASAKGTVLLNYCEIDKSLVDYVVDRNPRKQGCAIPGRNIQVDHPDRLKTDPPDYLLLLSWNLADEILHQEEEFQRAGGKFIVPIPEPRVLP